MITRDELDKLRQTELQKPEPTLKPNRPDRELVDRLVSEEQELERQALLRDGELTLDEAAAKLEHDLAFAAREGLAQAHFEQSVGDSFNAHSDKAAQIEHDLAVADDRLAAAVDEAMHLQEQDPDKALDPEIIKHIDQLNHDVESAEDLCDASRNHGLPLDPPLDVEKREYVLTRTVEQNGVEVSREEYVIARLADREDDREHDREHDRDR